MTSNKDRDDAVRLLEEKLHSMGGAFLRTWAVRGSAVWKLQSAIRYLLSETR